MMTKSRPTRPRSFRYRSRKSRIARRARHAAFAVALLAVGGAMAQPAKLKALVLSRAAEPAVLATPEAMGFSHSVDLTVALPGDSVHIPLDLGPDSNGVRYEWVRDGDSVQMALSLPLDRRPLYAPARPGFYHLALVRDTQELVLDTPTLGVMVPFEEKRGGEIDGYRIGTYRGERHGDEPRPDGFLVVTPADTGLAVSDHLRVSDFVTHDWQTDVWPKYVALRPRLLDKLELVMAQLERGTARREPMQLDLDVHSGFRTPLYNRTVPRAADDSRHQYGDAADVTLDANGDGRIDTADIEAIVQAVDAVEAAHPELVGGLGIYTSRRYPTPYVHIDTRGERKRWRG
jgi:uncharacterized protein YcbK (DUF882 family)